MRIRKVASIVMTAALASRLLFPSLAFATVRVDDTELQQGENAVGGGTATLAESVLDMYDVTAGTLATDENLTMNFNGSNDIETVYVEDSANVEMNFEGDNEVGDLVAIDDANVTVNANGNNEFQEVVLFDNANATINVTGENNFTEIAGFDNSSITVRGTDCQQKDILNVGNGEDYADVFVEEGSMTIDHVTVNLNAESSYVGSALGNTTIDTSKIAPGDAAKYTYIGAGGTMLIRESVIDIVGSIYSDGLMTIDHSDVKVTNPTGDYADYDPYAIWSSEGIELINEQNGEVKDCYLDGFDNWQVFYVDTGNGYDVNLKANSDPAYYKCGEESKKSSSSTSEKKGVAHLLAKTGDPSSSLWMAPFGLMLVAGGLLVRRKTSEC